MATYNEYPEFKATLGRPLKYTPQELLDKFAEYVEWCKAHPLANVMDSSGESNGNPYSRREVFVKPRMISIRGFMVHLGTSLDYWDKLHTGKQGVAFFRVKKQIESFCQDQQIQMASSGVYKENIIARLNGLTDKKEVKTEGEQTINVVETKEQKDKLDNIASLG